MAAILNTPPYVSAHVLAEVPPCTVAGLWTPFKPNDPDDDTELPRRLSGYLAGAGIDRLRHPADASDLAAMREALRAFLHRTGVRPARSVERWPILTTDDLRRDATELRPGYGLVGLITSGEHAEPHSGRNGPLETAVIGYLARYLAVQEPKPAWSETLSDVLVLAALP